MLNTNDIKKLEEYFVRYDDLIFKREYRRLTLLTKETDENIGTKSTALPQSRVENEVVRLTMDSYYNNIDKIIKAIDNIYNTCSDNERVVIECRYKKSVDTAYEWEDIAHHLTTQRTDDKVISRNAVLNIRNRILTRFAEQIGWVIV